MGTCMDLSIVVLPAIMRQTHLHHARNAYKPIFVSMNVRYFIQNIKELNNRYGVNYLWILRKKGVYKHIFEDHLHESFFARIIKILTKLFLLLRLS